VIAPVVIDSRARRAYGVPALPFPVGAIVVGLDGRVVRVVAGGALEPVLAGGHPHAGAASDPTNRRSAA
jgi:hypothetical protein